MEDQGTFAGTWYIAPTTFTETGELNLDDQGRVIEAAISWGVAGVTAMGVMAEPGSLTSSERAAALERVMDVARGRVPVVVGCSAASEHLVLSLAAEARALGAAGIMVAAPTL